MPESINNALRKVRDWYVVYEHRTQRGEALNAIFTSPIEAIIIKGGMIVLLCDKIFGFIPPVWSLIALYVFQKICEYISGFLDQRYLKVWERSEDWKRKNISRWEQKKLDAINQININIKDIQNKVDKL